MKQVLFTILFSLSTAVAMAQGFISEIKVLAVNDEDSISSAANGYKGYSGENDLDLDFRKGKGGGYVFSVFKTTDNPDEYITDVIVTNKKGDMYGRAFNEGGMDYIPAPYFQSHAHLDKTYYGGLNGRNYWIYGGKYRDQDHVYYSRTGLKDFNQRVLKWAEVRSSKPTPRSDQTVSGGHAGGGRYFLFTWHNHKSQYRIRGNDNIKTHDHYCSLDGCKLVVEEDHKFRQHYGHDAWMQYTTKTSKIDPDKVHYKKCDLCGKEVTQEHQFATYVADWGSHNKRCLTCDYVIKADHKNFGKQKLPVDDYYHMIFCGDCQFIKKLRHSLGRRNVLSSDCETTLVRYTCTQCYHSVFFNEEGSGHHYDENGFCTNKKCLHPYERPTVEYAANRQDSTFVIRTYGNLYWVSDYVNNRRPKTNIRLDNDLLAEDFVKKPWKPIGTTDSTAFEGTFDGGGHVITMLQTEEPVAGCGYRGLFGAIGKNGVVKNVNLAGCDMRGWDYIGAVAGVNDGTIENCKVIFSVMRSNDMGKNLGGICGLNRGTIKQCTTESNVWVGGVRDYAGGICGTNSKGTLTGNVFEAICGSGSDATLPEAASQQ